MCKKLDSIARRISVAVAAFMISISMIPAVKAAAEAEATFPLPADRSYKVSVLAKYSWGAYHRGYISADIYKTGAGGDSYSVMDIVAPMYTPIYAVADGTVYK